MPEVPIGISGSERGGEVLAPRYALPSGGNPSRVKLSGQDWRPQPPGLAHGRYHRMRGAHGDCRSLTPQPVERARPPVACAVRLAGGGSQVMLAIGDDGDVSAKGLD